MTDPLSLLFIGCFLIGLVFLLITAFLGHGHGALHHTGHVGHVALPHSGPHIATSHATAHTTHGAAHQAAQNGQKTQGTQGNFSLFAYVNPMMLALFLVGFGFLGFIFNATFPLALPLIFLLAVIGGLIITALFLTLLGRMFGNSEGATVQDVSDRTGLLGKVSITISANNMGEITYISPGGMRKSIPARSVDGQRLERDQEVVVVSYQRGVAEVDTWEHFVNQEESGLLEGPDSDELATLRALLDDTNKTDTEYVLRNDSQKE